MDYRRGEPRERRRARPNPYHAYVLSCGFTFIIIKKVIQGKGNLGLRTRRAEAFNAL
jgi:hypothetical protein